MTPAEANILLTKAALLDPRLKRVDQQDRVDMAAAWAEVLADVTLAEALDALSAHYRGETAAVLPGHIMAVVQTKRELAAWDGPRLSKLEQLVCVRSGMAPEEFAYLDPTMRRELVARYRPQLEARIDHESA